MLLIMHLLWLLIASCRDQGRQDRLGQQAAAAAAPAATLSALALACDGAPAARILRPSSSAITFARSDPYSPGSLFFLLI